MKTPKNPIAARVMPHQGQSLPADFIEKSQSYGGTYDRRDLKNMWRTPQWSAKPPADPNIVRDARLSK